MTEHDHVHDDRVERETYVDHARGGVSLLGVITGVVVAFGTMVLLTAVIGGVAVAIGVSDRLDPSATELTWGVAIAFVLAQFLGYLWGGYTAGRMARGAGLINGLLVPVVAIVFAALVAGLIALGADGTRVAFGPVQLPVTEDAAAQFGIGMGIAALIAMFVGGIMGGIMGARWHGRLEDRREVERRDELRAA